MCFRRARYWEERVEDTREERHIWDLFHREAERSEPPMPVLEGEEEPVAERDPDEVPVGAER